MKLTVLGGGGVRSPFLAKSLAEKAISLNIDTLIFMDNDKSKLEIYGKIAKNVCKLVDERIKFILTDDPIEALTDVDFVITTIRVGKDQGRIFDEKIALQHNVLGQETTGAGGFAMAMRSIPVLREYLELIKKYSKPDCKVFNFTNPSGLVTQALHSYGYHNVYGICDGPSEFIKELEHMLGLKYGDLTVDCYGLNHLSWFKNVMLNGNDILPQLIENDKMYEKTEMRFFDKDFVRWAGCLFNGYLYYYYSREEAVANILKSPLTRGETIKKINNEMNKTLANMDIDGDFANAYATYISYFEQRENSYMAIESGTKREVVRKLDLESLIKEKDDDGYAGVALRFIEGFVKNTSSRMVLIVPNNGAIEGLANEDTIEVSCTIDRNGAVPIPMGKINEFEMNLIRQIKLFERLSVVAIDNKNIMEANVALSVHPLVNSFSLSKKLVAEYLEAHKDYVGEWH